MIFGDDRPWGCNCVVLLVLALVGSGIYTVVQVVT